jgi:tetratricopeptide (TPR) repeat protein
LGYTWIKNNQNIDKAFSMIVEAYNQAPFDPSINDSLGFALYNLGYYTMSLPYLERAAELYPSSAVISSHLGDAYWFAHRKNEAKFQWQHALKLQDESGELDIAHTKNKIKNGLKQEPELTYSKEIIEETIKKIKK